MVRVFWSDQAKSDLFHIYQYIASDSVQYAKEHIKKLKFQTSILRQFPETGRIVPEFENENIREILYKNYRIVYLLNENKVITILTVFHGSRLLGAY